MNSKSRKKAAGSPKKTKSNEVYDDEFFISTTPQHSLEIETFEATKLHKKRRKDDVSRITSPLASIKSAVEPRSFEMKSDVEESRTIFIRNVSFDADEGKLKQFFSNFGEVEFVKIVKDKMTQHSRGTAFAKFLSKADADRILLESNQPENAYKFLFCGRQLILALAVSRDAAQKLQSARIEGNLSLNTVKKGRNLHLARIGMVRAGTQAAESLTSTELALRESIIRTKQAKLKDPSIYISAERLCLRNIPLDVDDKMLRKACQKVAGPKARIIECRVMKDFKTGAANPKSLGYAFVAFDEHTDALKVLQVINNNNSILGGKRRPIVEFSLENSRALEKKRRRMEKSASTKTTTVENQQEANRPQTKLGPVQAVASRKQKKKVIGNNRVRMFPKKFGAKIRHNRRSTAVGKQKMKKSKKAV